MSSTSLYNTFGNEVKYTVIEDTLIAYLENSTIKFTLPEASAEFLAQLFEDTSPVDPVLYEQVRERLVALGYQIGNARAMSTVLLKVAEAQGVSPLSYFSLNEDTLQFTIDAYEMINALRPAGNRIGLQLPLQNNRTLAAGLIQP
jgi:hypothetical protein